MKITKVSPILRNINEIFDKYGHKGRKDAVEEINCMLLEIKQALEYSIDGCQCNGTEKCRYCSNTKDVLRKYFII